MNNKLTDERVSNATLIRLIQWADQHNSHYVAAALCELQERRKADNQEPAGYHVIKECGKVGCSVATLEEAEKTRDFWNKKWTIRPYFYSAPPVQETGVYKDMLNIIGLLENNEWAEHCTSTVLGSLLESEITRLVGKEQPDPVVPDECPAELLAFCEQVIDSCITANAKADELWNDCRAAMHQSGNGTLTSEGTRQFDNSPVIPDGWISCSERMPEQDDWVLIYSKHGEYLAGQVQGEYVELNDGTLSWLGAALHWMPLPEPPQEVK